MAGQRSTKKCSICGLTFPKEEIKTMSAKNYCPECYAKRNKDIQDYKDLMDFIYNLAEKDETVMPLIATQVKRFKQDNGVTNEQILFTLKYMYDLKEPPVKFIPEYGIANLTFFFREAQMFYRENERLASASEQKIKESLNCEPIRITLKRSELIKQQQKFEEERQKKENHQLINLDEIDLEEDEAEDFNDEVVFNQRSMMEFRIKHKYDFKNDLNWGDD